MKENGIMANKETTQRERYMEDCPGFGVEDGKSSLDLSTDECRRCQESSKAMFAACSADVEAAKARLKMEAELTAEVESIKTEVATTAAEGPTLAQDGPKEDEMADGTAKAEATPAAKKTKVPAEPKVTKYGVLRGILSKPGEHSVESLAQACGFDVKNTRVALYRLSQAKYAGKLGPVDVRVSGGVARVGA